MFLFLRITFFVILTTITLNSFAQGCFFGGAPTSLGQVTKFSGSPHIDQVNTREYNYLVTKFSVMPDIFYLYDGNQPNAYATSRVSNPLFPDGTVLIGFSLIQQECMSSASGTCISVAIIMAHEFAHIVDFKYSTGLSGKHQELFADYLAGCYMYFRSVEFGFTFVPEAAQSFFRKGDYQFNSPSHHGTPQQRYNTLMAGYRLAQTYSTSGRFLTLDQAISSAIEYVSEL